MTDDNVIRVLSAEIRAVAQRVSVLESYNAAAEEGSQAVSGVLVDSGELAELRAAIDQLVEELQRR